jgi:hypothetical protein
MPVVMLNGTPPQRWPAAEKHYRAMSAKYVLPALAYAQQMAARPHYSDYKIACIVRLIKELEKLHKLYTGPITKNMEEVLAAADGFFRSAMKRLDQLDI